MLYTPLHPDYYIVHTSRHLPGPVVERLERLFQATRPEELEEKLMDAVTWFTETADLVQAKISERH